MANGRPLVIFVFMGFLYEKMIDNARKAVFSLYCLANFFQNFGPNTTTFIVPGEAFPTRYRSTAYGISAASGKLGAIISQVVFAVLKKHNDDFRAAYIGHMFKVFALLMLTGLFATFLIEETKGRTLEGTSILYDFSIPQLTYLPM